MNNGLYGLSTRTTNGLFNAGVDLATEDSARRGAATVYGNGKFFRTRQVGKKCVRELEEWLWRGGNGSAGDRKCPSCRFWDKSDEGRGDMGSCRRYAPRPTPGNDSVYWAMTYDTDWCGEWAQR